MFLQSVSVHSYLLCEWLSCSAQRVNITATFFFFFFTMTLIYPLFHTINPPAEPLLFIFSSSSWVSLFLLLIHLSPSDKKPVSGVLFLRLSREVPVHHLIPEGTATPSTLPPLKIKHIKSSNGCFPSPPPSLHWGWHFSHFTHHYIQPVFIAAHQRRGQEEALLPYLTSFLSFECLSFSTSCCNRSLMTPALCVCVCVCVF